MIEENRIDELVVGALVDEDALNPQHASKYHDADDEKTLDQADRIFQRSNLTYRDGKDRDNANRDQRRQDRAEEICLGVQPIYLVVKSTLTLQQSRLDQIQLTNNLVGELPSFGRRRQPSLNRAGCQQVLEPLITAR